jgi:predicted aspartyl protease
MLPAGSDAPGALARIGRRAAVLGSLAMLAAAAPRPHAVATDIPIDIVGGRCFVRVRLDNRPATLLLDTGAETTLLCEAAANRLLLRPDAWVSTTLRGAGGLLERHANVDVRVAMAGAVRLFQNRNDAGLNLPVTTADLAGADGLLGGDVLRNFALDLDLPASRAALLPPRAAPPMPGAVRLQALRRTLLLAPVSLDGHALTALLDTGSSMSMLNARGLFRMGLAQPLAAPEFTAATHAVGGRSLGGTRRFAELRLGPLTVANPNLLLIAVPSAAYDLLLGLDVLGAQSLRLSYDDLALTFA